MIVLPRLRLLSGTIAYRPARIPPFICGARLARWSEGDSGVFKVALLCRRNNPVLTFKTFAFFEEIDCLPGCARYLAADGHVPSGSGGPPLQGRMRWRGCSPGGRDRHPDGGH